MAFGLPLGWLVALAVDALAELDVDRVVVVVGHGAEMVEKIAELDDTLMEKFLTDPNTITVDELKKALRKGTIALKCFPVLCGSALKYGLMIWLFLICITSKMRHYFLIFC